MNARMWLVLGMLGASLAASPAHAIDPATAACLDANEKSVALRADHRLLASREQLVRCAAASCPEEVRTECARRLDVVNAAIPTIVLEAEDAKGNDLPDVHVSIDGAAAVKIDGGALSLDPGRHAFRFEAAGQAPVERTFVLREGEKGRRERIVFGASERARTTAAAPQARGDTRTLGLVVGAAGVVAVGVGTFFGLRAMSLWSSSQSECASAASCPQHDQAVSDHDAAVTSATVATIAFVAGGAALAAGAVLYFGRWSVTPSAGASAASLQLRTTF